MIYIYIYIQLEYSEIWLDSFNMEYALGLCPGPWSASITHGFHLHKSLNSVTELAHAAAGL